MLKRKLTFQDLEEPQQSYVPFKKAKKEPNYARMSKKVFHLLITGEYPYSELNSYLDNHVSQELEKFYQQRTNEILHFFLIHFSKHAALAFLLAKIPIDEVIKALIEGNLLRRFITIENKLENENFSTDEIEEFSNKIMLLLALNEPKIKEAIIAIINEDDMSEKLRTIVNDLITPNKSYYLT